jgi:hypothetical protein
MVRVDDTGVSPGHTGDSVRNPRSVMVGLVPTIRCAFLLDVYRILGTSSRRTPV